MTSTDVLDVSDAPATDPVEEALGALGRAAEAEVDRLEADRRLPDDWFRAIAAAGLFRQLVPEALGGRGDDPIVWFRRGVRLARHEPSLGWVVTQGAAELGWIAAGAPLGWAAEVLLDPDAASASTVAGLGTLRVGDRDGYGTLAGEWGFDTGCQGATWIGGLAVVEGGPHAGQLRMCWVPAARATIADDWDSTGLRGTGSHRVAIAAQEVPLSWTAAIFEPTTEDRGPHRCLVGNGNWPIATAVAATQLGNARRALDEARSLVHRKAPAPAFTPLASNAAVQRRIGELEGRWAAAVAGVERELDELWAEAVGAGALTAACRARTALANLNANRTALEVVDGACELAGTAVAARTGTLGRALRDAHTLRGHVAVSGAVAERAGQVLLGLADPDLLL